MLRRFDARVLRAALGVAPRLRSATAMQLRTRSGSATASPKAGTVAPLDRVATATTTKRRRKAADPATVAIKEEARATEAVAAIATTQRRSPRQRVKREPDEIKAEPTEETQATAEEVENDDDGTPTTKSTKKRRLRVVKRGADGRPEKWEDVLRGIQEIRASQIADVDVAGVEAMFEDGKFEPHVTRFHVLISAMLSSQTKDPVNAAAMKRLIARGLTVSEMLAIDEAELAQLIHPVGFYNNKARYIKQVAQLLTDAAAEANAAVVDIPDTFDALVALPGVGPKMAHLVMSCAWDNTVGICVDTHVHRISNRLGWVKTWNKLNPKSQDPEKTRKELEDWLPREHWGPINVTLVGFGQTVCLPRGPKCSECKISHLCPSAFSSAI